MKKMGKSHFSLGFLICLCIINLEVKAEDPYKFFTWTVTYGIRSPLGTPQQVILINGQFPGPQLDVVTNDNIILNLINQLDQPFLLTWNGIKQRKNSWQDGVLGTNCPIPPNSNFTYKLQPKDQIGTFTYFPSTMMHKAAGGYGGLNVFSRPGIPIPYPYPDGDFTLLVGDWSKTSHKEIPEPFPLPTNASIVKAAAGWAHCVAATVNGEVYTWGWKECVPNGKVLAGGTLEKDQIDRNSSLLTEQGSPQSQVVKSYGFESRGVEENTKRRRISSAKQAAESSSSNDETQGALPCLVSLNAGIRVVSVAAGGRHTIVLSDIGQVWGWGYGGEGQLGLGSRIRMVSSPHPVPCFEGQISKVPGSYIKSIACGGRHTVALTDAGALLAFGWGLYGQCGQGSTDDELSPTCVSSLLGIPIGGIAAGLWHTVCVSVEGDMYSFGGNQFGQLGTGTDQAETLPRLLDAPSIEDKHARTVSCGARHTAVITDEGDVFCWGWNKYGQLGLGDVVDRDIPCQVPGITGYSMPINVACGWWHTLLLAQSPT